MIIKTQSEFIEIMNESKYNGIASIFTRTELKLNKKDRVTKAPAPFEKLIKASMSNIFLGHDYQKAVNNQRAREDISEEFKAESLWRGAGYHVNKYIVGNKNNGKHYLMYRMIGDEDNAPKKIITKYYREDTNEEVKAKDYENYLPKGYFEPRDSGKQEVDRTIMISTVSLGNIIDVTFNGETYRII